MRKASMCSLRWGGLFRVPLPVFVPAVSLCLLILSPEALCESWEPFGPEGGNFIFSMSHPEDANEITAITSNPSPPNVYKSTDGGASWSKIGEIPYPYVSDVSAFDFSTLYAISSSRCFRSADGGATWTESRLPSSVGWAYHVCVDPTDSRKVYAAGNYSDYSNYTFTDSMVIFKSTDGGLSWNASQFFTYEHFYPYDMAISATNPNVMYVVGSKGVNNQYGGALMTSTDGGQSWTDISSDLTTERYSSFYCVAIDPTDDGKVYVGGEYIYRGTRTGRTQELAWTRGPTRLYVNTISIDPVDPSRIYAGAYESIAVSTNSGLSWSLRNNCIKSSAGHIAVAPADPSTVHVSTYTGFYKSSDWGSNWATAHSGIRAASINALAVDPSVILAHNSGYLMAHGRGRSNTWEDVVTPESCGQVCDILMNPDNRNAVLILEGYG